MRSGNWLRIIRISPAFAIGRSRAVLGLVDLYVRNEHRHSLSDPIIETFDLNGRKASVITDYSHIWTTVRAKITKSRS